MKKVFSALLIFVLVLTFASCETKNYTPDVTSDFNQSAVVTTGDFTYKCKISRIKGKIIVEIMSTSAKGLVMTYDGKLVHYNYLNMKYEAQGKDLEKSNPAIAIYDVFQFITNAELLNAKKTDSGYKYEGTTAIGKFILYQSNDSTYDSLHFLNCDILIEFE